LAAILEAGGSPLLVHWKTPAAEFKRTALRFGASFVLCDSCPEAELAAIGAQAAVMEFTPWFRGAWLSIDASEPGFCGDYPSPAGVPLHPTSGSTGLPKVAARPGSTAIAEASHYVQTTGIDHRDVLLVATPMSHAYAYGMGVMVPLLTSATVVSVRQFSVTAIQAALRERGITIFPAVPAMLDMLLFGAGAKLLATPRQVLSAGSPLARRTISNFHRATGSSIRPLYGTTETGGITVGMSGVLPEMGGWVGPPMDGVEVRIAPAQGAALQEGVGPVEIRSSSLMAGYLDRQGIDSSWTPQGWFQTGDLGRLDAASGIHLVGRETDVINVSGMKVVPSEVEEVLALFPGMIECKVYAGEQRSGGQFVKAAIVTEGQLDLDRLRAHCEEHLVYYKRPDVFLRLDALPRSPAGKIQKDKLP
jgi:acyl-CoA synthetase (AMP-forming)/AMP-acid ligase II